jgi:hypothetical protein
LFENLVKLHKNGVHHRNVDPCNVILKTEHPVIINFSHVQLDHKCPGRATCEELLGVWTNLKDYNPLTLNGSFTATTLDEDRASGVELTARM